MARTSIVTDSTSGLSPEEVRPLGIATIPMHIEISGQTYLEGVDLSIPEYYRLVSNDSALPRTSPPSVREFHDLFRKLARESEEIIAVLVSSRLSAAVSTARQAAHTYLGRTRVTVIDSRLAATPLGWLAMAAGEAAMAGVDTREIIRLLRSMISRTYIAFFVESVKQLEARGLHPRAAALPATAAAAKPLLMIEEGEIMPLERSRSRGRAVERLFDFVTEFSHIERIGILQGKPLPEGIELATMIAEELPEQPVETRLYPASIAAHVGNDALGVAIYEGLG
jgi:DegV family protein with EDD domain